MTPDRPGALGRAARAHRRHGLRNSLLIAIAPTATIASIAGCYECIEPQVSNLFKRETLSGDFLQINRYLVARAEGAAACGTTTMRDAHQARRRLGAGHRRAARPSSRAIYRTAWEIPMRSLIDMAADRGAFIDQSQSLNLFMESPNIGKLSSMYLYAWKNGLKTTYYLRSRPATRIAKATVQATSNYVAPPAAQEALAPVYNAPEPVAEPEVEKLETQHLAQIGPMLVAPSAAPLNNGTYTNGNGHAAPPAPEAPSWSPALTAPASPPRPVAIGWGETAPVAPVHAPAEPVAPEPPVTVPVNTFAPSARPPIAPPVASWGAPPPPAAPASVQAAAPTVTSALELPEKFDNIEAFEIVKTYTDEEAVACSLENPESCEACQ